MHDHDLQGESVPTETDSCAAVSSDLFSGDDQCSRNVQEVVFNGNESLSAILALYEGDCPARFEEFATACSDEPQYSEVCKQLLYFSYFQ